ncbi:MAG: 50S ribosomal protein L25 [Spirochaetes bacterium]|jgi:large subunit ribosomal protein L25|nr:50S ribosomal protein L25 [Spirochaetota bacterium]
MANRIVEADNRNEFGKGPAGRLRRSGKLPGIIYGRSDTLPITLDQHDFYQTFKQISESTIITIRTPKKDVDVLLKDFDEDLATGHLRHVDFYAIESGQLLRANVPVHLTGAAPGVREGGVLQSQIHEIEVECLPKDIPEYFELDISGLQVGDSLHVADLSDLDGVKVLNSEDQTIALVAMTREEVEEEVEDEEMEGEEGLEEGEEAGETEEAEE